LDNRYHGDYFSPWLRDETLAKDKPLIARTLFTGGFAREYLMAMAKAFVSIARA